MSIKSAALAGAALVAIALTGSIPATAGPAARVAKANPPMFFAQTRSDVTPDPKARFGRLPNGMTYVIYRHPTPPGVAKVRLRIDAGSMMEKDYQRGLAHFLEHMAFNGTKNVPEGEMVRILERHGLSFGADTNAYTSPDETVYMLDLPNVRPATVDTALFLMRELAGNMTISPAAVDRERGVVLGEERARDSVEDRAREDAQLAQFAGQAFPKRMPIGDVTVLRTASAQALRDFYRDFYRPEYATLIVVGDVDPQAIERDIRARFANWRPAPQSPNALTDFGTYRDKGPVSHVFTAPGLMRVIRLTWATPWVDKVETTQSAYEELMSQVAYGAISRRLSRLERAPDAPFLNALFLRQFIKDTADTRTLIVQPREGQTRAALEEALGAVRQVLAEGITQRELDASLRQTEAIYRLEAARADTRDSGAIAAGIINAVGNQKVFTSPAQDLDFFLKAKERMTLASVNDYLRTTPLGDGPFISQSGESVADLDKAAAVRTYAAIMAKPLGVAAVPDIAPWPYTAFGTPGRVASREAIPQTGATRVRFDNGVTLTVRPSAFDRDQISVIVNFHKGFLDLPAASRPLAMLSENVGLLDGGLKRIDALQMRDTLAGTLFNATFGIGENDTSMTGSTTTRDFATQMQVLRALTTDAAFDPTAFQRARGRLPDFYRSLRLTPSATFGAEIGGILADGDGHFRMPTLAEAMAVTSDQMRALVTNILDTAPIDILIVGDIAPDTAIAEVAKTFGTLPARAAATTDLPRYAKHFPHADLNRVLEHEGRADQNYSFIAWPTTDLFADEQRSAGLAILSEIISARLLDEVRERQGAAYSPGSSNVMSPYPGYGYLSVSAEVKPDMDQRFYDTVKGIVADLKTHPISADELLRAREPVLERLRNARNRNDYWADMLSGSISDPRNISLRLAREEKLKKVDAAMIEALAREYLDMGKALRVQVKPKGGAPGAVAKGT